MQTTSSNESAGISTSLLIDPKTLDRADRILTHEPFAFLIAHEQLPRAAASELDRDFPRYPSAGFFPETKGSDLVLTH